MTSKRPAQVQGSRDADRKETPVEPPDEELGEKLVVKDLQALTHRERVAICEEIHGVRDATAFETAQALHIGLNQMDQELSLLRSRGGARTSILDRATFLVPRRVQDWNLRLQFLRSERYSPIRAAHRFIRYLDWSFESFGYDGLLRDVLLSDLTAEEMAILKSGVMQPLFDTRDRSGRPIVLFLDALGRHGNKQKMLRRVAFYIFMRILKDPIVQHKGFVWISWNVDPVPSVICQVQPQQNTLSDSMAFFAALPLRMVAVHYCFDNMSKHSRLNLLKIVIGALGRVRFRTHFGDATTCHRGLLSFGIDLGQIPSQLATNGPTFQFHQWILAATETSDASFQSHTGAGLVPRSTDVLLGRGKPFREFPGNRRLNQKVLEQWESYNSLPRRDKTFFIEEFARNVTNEGTRFLKRASPQDPWTEVGYSRILEKVSTAFRNKPLMDRYHEEQEARKKQLEDGKTDVAEQKRQSPSSDDEKVYSKNLDFAAFPPRPPE